jgi:hypothetical protein
MKNKHHIKVSIHMVIDGKVQNLKEVLYERGSETYCYTLDDLARVIFMWERIFSPHSTYAMDGYLQEAEKKLAKRDNETAQSCFEKYWINIKETIDKEFSDINNGSDSIFPEVNDYLAYSIAELCRSIHHKPLVVQQGFLYYLFKYIENSSIKEFEQDIYLIPDYIKEIVDNKVVQKKSDSE